MKIVTHLEKIPFTGIAITAACAALLIVFTPAPVRAYFSMLIPTTNQIEKPDQEVSVTLSSSQPFRNIGMDLSWPKDFFVVSGEDRQDLKGFMLETKFMEHQAWKINFKPQRPGVYWFAMESTPNLDPAENIFIIHYSKTVLAAYGGHEGWDTAIGLKTEIVPLLRPFGNYSGNTFVGRVLLDDAPAAGVNVEVEHYNQESWVAATDAHITQVVKTDDNGIFLFTCPLPGWWGFSAQIPTDFTLKGPDNREKHVELNAVIWVYLDPNPFTGQ